MNENNLLLKECIDNLEHGNINYSITSSTLFEDFENQVKFTFYGRIDWNLYPLRKSVENIKDIFNYIDSEDIGFILWNDSSLPVIQTNIKKLFENLDDVLAVSFDTWIWIKTKNIIIEFFHDGSITLLEIETLTQFDMENFDI